MASVKIHYYVAATLDGFIARRDGSVDFLEAFEDPACDYGYAEFIASIGTVVMGRKTYEDALRLGKGVWPYGGKHAVVFTRDAARAAAGSPHAELTTASPLEVVRALRRGEEQGAGGGAGPAACGSGGGSLAYAVAHGGGQRQQEASHQAKQRQEEGVQGMGAQAVGGDKEPAGDGDGQGSSGGGGDHGGSGGRDVWVVGGGALAGGLLAGGCVDRVTVAVLPLLLGRAGGVPLLGTGGAGGRVGGGDGDGGDARLRLLRSRPFPNGLVLNEYEVVH